MSQANKEIVEKINTAFSENKPEEFLNHCTDDVKWEMVGEGAHSGKESIREFMASMPGTEPPNFNVIAMIADDDRVVCYGDMTMKMEGEEGSYSYCDIYRFSGDKVSELRSYVVKQKDEGEKDQAASA
jgi:predicted SnoaL-like aldol condensation-catalyzing enzyme